MEKLREKVISVTQADNSANEVPYTSDIMPNGESLGVLGNSGVTRDLQTSVSPDEAVARTRTEQNLENATQEPEFGNMTEHAVIVHLQGNKEIAPDFLIQGYTVNQWRAAQDFNMTPRQFEVYSGKAPLAE